MQFLKEKDEVAYRKAGALHVANGAFLRTTDDLIVETDGLWSRARKRGDFVEYWTPTEMLK